MSTNDFLPFCPTDTGTNLESQSTYAADPNRTDGNQPGVASSKLNNKALRQGTYVSGQVAQYVSDTTATDVLDDNTPAKLLAQVNASFTRLAPILTKYTSSSGTHNVSYVFMIASGNATVGATYTNNSVTYTVSATVAAAVRVIMTGNGAPTTSGTLTKASGTGDSTLAFYAVRAPLFLRVRMVGGGGGGTGSGTSAGAAATAGGNTTFGTSLLVANGGGISGQASTGGAGGTASLGSGPVGVATTGSQGDPGTNATGTSGGSGGGSAFGGKGSGGPGNATGTAGVAAAANSGSGGGGAGSSTVATDAACPGGGAGGYVDAVINTPLSTYAYAVGSAGSAGGAGSGGKVGGAGSAGLILVEEHYQ